MLISVGALSTKNVASLAQATKSHGCCFYLRAYYDRMAGHENEAIIRTLSITHSPLHHCGRREYSEFNLFQTAATSLRSIDSSIPTINTAS